jgi:hypothetical protein
MSGASLPGRLAPRLPKGCALLAMVVVTIVVGTCAPVGAHVAIGDVGSDRVTATAGTIQPGDLPADYATVLPATSDPRGIDTALPGATHVKECGSLVATFTGRRARREPTSLADGPKLQSDQPTGARSVVSALVVYRDRPSADGAFAPLAAGTAEHCLDSVIVRQAKETSATHAGDRSLKVETVKSVTSRHSGARIGDSRTGYSVKVTITLKRGSTTRKISTLADVQFVQVGRAIAAYVMLGVGAPIEDGAWQPVVATAAGRLEPASALDTLNEFRADVGARPLSPAAGDVAAEAQALVTCLAAGGEGRMPTPHTPDLAVRCNGAADFDLAVSGGMNSAISVDDPSTPAGSVVEKLVRAPYHGLTLALPSLVGAAYSDAVSPSGGLRAAGRPRQFAALDVFGAGIAEGSGPTRPLMSWPAAGVSVPGTMTTSDEWPDPVRACGWQQAGPPMWVATGIPTGPEGPTPTLEVTNVALTDAGGRPVATRWCRISRATNPHADVNDERSIVASALGGMNAEVWLPSSSLAPGRYRMSWTTSSGQVASDFTVRG